IGYRLDADVRPISSVDRQQAGELYITAKSNFNDHTDITMRAVVQHCLDVLKLNPHGLPEINMTLAYAYINLGHVGYCAELPADTMPKAKQAAEAMLAEVPESAAAYGVLGLIALIWEYDWNRAEALLKKAVTLDRRESAALLTYAHLLIIK